MRERSVIETDGMSVGYDGKVVLRDVSISVKERDFLGIVGPNGCGKTSLIKVLLGLMSPMSGSVRYMRDGNTVKSLSMGYLPQYTSLDRKFPVSVHDVVLSGLKPPLRPYASYSDSQQERVGEVLHTLEIDHLQHRHIGELSGGQLQRVLLARAIVSGPEVLVLDEPNTYIDRHFQTQLYTMLSRINESCAVVIVSHDIDSVLNNSKHVAIVNRSVRLCPAADVTEEDIAGIMRC